MTRIFLLIVTFVLLSSDAVQAQTKLPWLHVDGKNLVDETGKPVVLRGINLGGWLVEEIWMMPFVANPPEGTDAPKITDHVSLWSTVEKSLGKEAMQRMRVNLRNAWISEADFDRIAAAKMNCIRLPFLCDSLEPPDDLYFWLDRALDWAGKRGIYVILDMHGAPGRQSKDHHTGQEAVNRFFFDDANIARTEKIWSEIAKRYRDRPEVAGYDVLNEPMGAPNQGTLYVAQDRLYRAIRSSDDKHVIFIEDGYKGLDQMPDPRVVGWKNTALSIHTYKFDAKGPQDQYDHLAQVTEKMEKAQQTLAVPFYMGEFNTPRGNAQTIAKFCSTMEEHGWSWTIWTYKVAGGRGGRTTWGWVCAKSNPEKLDPHRDTEEEWNRKLPSLRTENMDVQDEIGEALSGKLK